MPIIKFFNKNLEFLIAISPSFVNKQDTFVFYNFCLYILTRLVNLVLVQV